MTYRMKRKRITKTIKLNKKHFIKLWLKPWIMTTSGCVWSVSMVVCQSKRQANDWMTKKRNQRNRKIIINLTGKVANKAQAIGVRVLRQWTSVIPPGDSLAFDCSCANKEKQFRVWKKWFTKHESSKWIINDDLKTFFFYRSLHLE